MIEDGICEKENGLLSKTIKFADINYEIAKKEDQIDIFSKYCEFLNYFDENINVQINIQNRFINKETFKKKMLIAIKEEDEENIKKYKKEFNTMLLEKASQRQNNVIRDKYITFTVKADTYEMAVPLLARIETDIMNNLKTLGAGDKVLTGRERVENLYNFFNQEQEIEFDYDYLIKTGLTTKDFISPNLFDFTDKRTFTFNDTYAQVIRIKDLPTDLSDKILSEISSLNLNLNISLHIEAVEKQVALDLVKRKIAFMEQQKIDEQKKAIKANYDVDMIPHELKYSLDEAEQLLDDLQNKNQRMFTMTALIYTCANSMEVLKEQIFQIASVCRQNGCMVETLDYCQENALNSILPLGKNHINIKRTLTTASTAIFMPFSTQELYQENGLYYGLNALSHNMILANRKALKTPSGFILGTPGSGKSFKAKTEIVNVLLSTDDDVIIIDPEAEYQYLTKCFKGTNIHISAGSKEHINPMDITENYDEDPLKLKAEFILSLCDLLIGGRNGVSATEKAIIDRAVTLTYTKKFSGMSKKIPTLKDFYNTLKAQPEPEAQNVALALELYIKGSLSVFAQDTDIDLNNRLITFDIKDLGKELKTMGMLIVLDQIWNRVTQNRQKGKRTWLYIDEIYLLFQNEYSANYLFELYKRARKWGVIPTGITQNVEDLLISDLARRMLSNSDFIIMLNQATSDRLELAGLLDISNQQLSFVTNSKEGQGLMFAGDSIIPFIDNFPKETELYKMMTTKIEEVEIVKNEINNNK